MVAPGWQVQVESTAQQLIPLAGLTRRAQQVIQMQRGPGPFRKGQLKIALPRVGRIIYYHQPAFAVLALPGKGDVVVPGGVALPGRGAFQKLPLAVTYKVLPLAQASAHRQFDLGLCRLLGRGIFA
jgi:hypothetical protein